MAQVPCPMCGWDAQAQRESGRDAMFVECHLCGRYIISGLLVTLIPRFEEQDRAFLPYLRAHTRQATEAGQVTELTNENWRDLAAGHRNTRVPEKVRKVLEYVAAHSGFPGDQVEINLHSMPPLFDAVSEDELRYLVYHLVERVLLAQGSLDGHYVLTVDGWVSLEPTPSGVRGRCFVAMSFDASVQAAYDHGIRPAVQDDCGLQPIRVDQIQHAGKICDRILAEIRLAQFVVADFTLHRAGVYFEAGFAMGLGRPVIWTCSKDQLAEAHFDTRQYNHIEWETPAELRQKLADRIHAIIPR